MTCVHCEYHAAAMDCRSCGNDICRTCYVRPCMYFVECFCGRELPGHETHFADGDYRCDGCDPFVECDHCGRSVRRHEIETVDVPDYGTPLRYGYAYDRYEVCAECAGNETCEDCKGAA